MSAKRGQWFIPGEGIAREVITADIQRYLGQDALVRPGERDGVSGFIITAYRNLTSEMIVDLQQDSYRWRQEQGRGSPHVRESASSRNPDKVLGRYEDSQIHQARQYYGPSSTMPEQPYGGQQAAASSYPADRRAPQQQQQQQQPQQAYPSPAYSSGYPPPQGYAYGTTPSPEYTTASLPQQPPPQQQYGHSGAQQYAPPSQYGQSQVPRSAQNYPYPQGGNGREQIPPYGYPSQQPPAAHQGYTYATGAGPVTGAPPRDAVYSPASASSSSQYGYADPRAAAYPQQQPQSSRDRHPRR